MAAAATPISQEYKTVDQLRTRLQQLATSLSLLRHELESSQSLPSWPALQTASSNLAASFQSLAQVLSTQRTLLSSAHAYPNPTFPAWTQENMLQGLLRKKLDPKAEDYIDRELDKQPPTDEDRQELWEAAMEIVEALREGLEAELDKGDGYLVPKLGAWGDFFSIEEREEGVWKVKTGVRRKLWEDDEGEDVVMRDAGKDGKEGTTMMPLESLLKFSVGAGLPQGGRI